MPYIRPINNKVLEKEALNKGLIVDNGKGSVYFIYNAGKKVGYYEGNEAFWVRAELTSGNYYHGHPIAGETLAKYLRIAQQR